eukprot:COSAG02_NODE_2871_length_7858_cov_7.040211_1_plen_116_part_00
MTSKPRVSRVPACMAPGGRARARAGSVAARLAQVLKSWAGRTHGGEGGVSAPSEGSRAALHFSCVPRTCGSSVSELATGVPGVAFCACGGAQCHGVRTFRFVFLVAEFYSLSLIA